MVAVAFPYINVTINTQALTPIAQRSPGVVAIVGVAATGSAALNTPLVLSSSDEAAALFASSTAGAVTPTPLYTALVTVLQQDPAPSKVYGVKVAADGHAAGLAALDGVDDVTIVALAGITALGTASGANPATGLLALKEHVENVSAGGNRRIGVAAIDPTRARTNDYVAKLVTDYGALKSDDSRMVLVAARGATGDLGAAAAGAIAGNSPYVSILLKQLRGISIASGAQYAPSEIKAMSAECITPIIDPELIPGTGLFFGDGKAFTSDVSRLYVDTVRTLDDLEYRLKAGLIGLIGDARITKSGLTRVKTRIEGILEPLERADVLADFEVQIPVLDILARPESTWSAGEQQTVADARLSRACDVACNVHIGPNVHLLNVALALLP